MSSIVSCLEKINLALIPYLPLGGLGVQDPLSVELHGCVTAYARLVQQQQTQPEAVLVQLKVLMRKHLRLSDESSLRAISEDVTRWVIAAYFPDGPSVLIPTDAARM